MFARLGLQPPPQGREPGFEPLTWLYRKMSLVVRLVYFFFIAAHHDWIDPILRNYDNQRAEEVRMQEAATNLIRIRNEINRRG